MSQPVDFINTAISTLFHLHFNPRVKLIKQYLNYLKYSTEKLFSEWISINDVINAKVYMNL